MGKLLKYVSFFVLILIALSFFFDALYTNLYNRHVPREKAAWLRTKTKTDKIDYVLIGSSRCLNDLDPRIIEARTGKVGMNLGNRSSGPFENKLMVLQAIKSTNARQIFIQEDYMYNVFTPDNIAETKWLPYLKEEDIYAEFKPFGSRYFYMRHVPFLRYQLNDPVVGFRNVAFMSLGMKAPFSESMGFVPHHGTLGFEDVYLDTIQDIQNPIYEDIIKLCAAENIELIFFTAPFYNSKTDFAVLAKYLPNYTDFSNSISNRNLFADVKHLNDDGAIAFTNLFCDTYFLEDSSLKSNVEGLDSTEIK